MSTIKIRYNAYPGVPDLINSLEPIIDANINTLRTMQDLITVPMECNLKMLFAKFREVAQGKSIQLSIMEEKNLSFHFYEMEKNLVDFYLNIYLPAHWHNTLIKGLMHAILLYYHTDLPDRVRKLLNEHSSDLSPVQQVAYRYISTNNGPSQLADELKTANIPVTSSPAYVLGQNTIFTYPYFEDVILAYYKDVKCIEDSVKETIADVLEKQNKSKFNKILLPQITLDINRKNVDDKTKQNLISLCENYIGSSNNLVLWTDDSLTRQQSDNLTEARHIICRWLLEKAIYKVFSYATGDYTKERSRFWQQYAKTLYDSNLDSNPKEFFRVVSSDRSVISDLVCLGWNNYKHINQSQNETVVLMRFGNYSIVEFLSGGCMYAYEKQSHSKYFYIWRDSRGSFDDFKSNNIVELYHKDVMDGPKITGSFKIAHRGEWRTVFRHLLLQLGIQPQPHH